MNYSPDVIANTQKNKSYCSDDPLIKYVSSHSLRLHPTQRKLIEATRDTANGFLLSSADQIQLLANLCKHMGYRRAIDLGTFTGYSALSIALALPEDGHVLTCDVTDKYLSLGRDIWKEAGVSDKISFEIGPATETLRKHVENGDRGKFDFAFIDADKVNYDQYYELCIELVRSGGLIAFDNVFWGGAVTDSSKTDDITLSIRSINDKLATDERVDISMLTVADGLTLAFKR